MSLSKSKYCNGLQCKKMLWLYKNKKEEATQVDNERVIEQGNLVHAVAKYLFNEHINIPYNDNLEEMIKNTLATIESYKNVIITEASFNYKNNFCSVDILKKSNDSYEIYEIKSSTEIKDIYVNDVAFQYYVLSNLGYKIDKCYLVHLNREYVRKDKLDLDELFNKEDILDEVISLQEEVGRNIDKINTYLEQEEEPQDDIDMKCFDPYPCAFFKYCTKDLEEDNVFKIPGMQKKKKIEYYKKNIYTYKDLLNQSINKKYKEQIEFELYNKEDYIDKNQIKEFLSTLTYPLYFLDFETFQTPIPLFNNSSCYEQIPFQYSLHYIEDNNLYHKEFLAEPGIDPRRELAESLVKDIPKDVCVLAYNMSFEKGVIKKLAMLYPDLSNHLLNIYSNIKDLMIPFQKRYYYTKNMYGSYSIKYVLPALFPFDENLDYHNLDLIHNGSEAMNSYVKMSSLSKKEQEYIKERLLRYCELDTYAMVKIYEKLQDVVNDKSS